MSALPREPARSVISSIESSERGKRRARWGLGDERVAVFFLLPNLIGVLLFVVFPVVFSLTMAFTNWDLTQQNAFSDKPIRLVGLRNFIDLISEGQFLRFLGNTLFIMMGIPVGMAGSLGAAMLLMSDARPASRRAAFILAGVGLCLGVLALVAAGAPGAGVTILIGGVFCVVLGSGVALGPTFYRTVFYTPHFVAGVATFILWKKLYNPQDGPINGALRPVLGGVEAAVNASPVWVISLLVWVLLGAMLTLFWVGLDRLRSRWRDGELGGVAAVFPLLALHVPWAVAMTWTPTRAFAPLLVAWVVLAGMAQLWRAVREKDRFRTRPTEGFGGAMFVSVLTMVGMLIALGMVAVTAHLPTMADQGLEPPNWLTSIGWAKPALMIMGFWGAIGSNNMLLYLAALTNVSPELYEAADIDGANRLQRFWNVTWPQLAPTTFFILVMSTIAGLQGGFEQARVMTNGGPAGATTTLSYFIYIEGFQTGRLGFASAVAWGLFALIFGVTLINWRFGNKSVSD
ncbi:MAG: sugar ABC transporter permease [Planctomycetota bacterium]